MKLYFKVPPEADGMLLRGFLRRCSISTDLSRAVKFRGSGFFADGAPVLANRRVEAGQVISFELPPEGEGVAPQDLAVHPTLNYPLDTLANGYAAWALRQGRSPVFRPVNRIDKDTSGLVLAAQNGYAAPLLAHAHRHLAAYKCPREIIFTDSLPRTANGKVRRRDLARWGR
jgi:23S rRNA pseudouridine1911/1915/1917 synthase